MSMVVIHSSIIFTKKIVKVTELEQKGSLKILKGEQKKILKVIN
jgi:hypothetical protein